ncbi:two-component sensor histidine kinase [Blastococcus sp. TF02-8]|uniref:sensor histidine kinase n=1 Tax=Blastococcus sp. TF02-8 TaxID=2250574 RepID=UPI000DE86B31|nr:ATP-binding protein [Blastococcus sp. TF02-8]RBY92472.1 two-component sensor histidine kinase [Blastococcus sp. TF02-8]
MSSSLARRLGLGFAAIALVAALLAALLVNLAFSSRFESYLDQQRSARVDQIAAAVTGAYVSAEGWDPERLDQLGPAVSMAGAEVRLVDAAGETVWPTAGSTTSEMAQMHREMMAAGPLADPVTVPITVDGQPRGTLLVALPEGSVPLADRQLRSSVNRLLFVGGLAVALIASVLGLLFARRVTRPLAELTAAADDLRAGDRGRRAMVSGRDEVAELATAFNELAASAERQEALRQSFAADVAHELRTPLAILRSQLEAVQDGVLDLTPALVSSLHEETLRLGRLVADLETLTRDDHNSFSLERVTLDLAELVRSVAAGFQHRFAERGLQLDLRLTPAPVCGDRVRLAQVVTNLLGNAVKFVPGGGRVTVTTGTQGDAVHLEVSDDGPGIPDAELPQVFDRYFRGRGARANGSGIGLAVVATLVRAHGGGVSATNAPDGGAVFTITFPLAEPSGSATASARPPSAVARGPLPESSTAPPLQE